MRWIFLNNGKTDDKIRETMRRQRKLSRKRSSYSSAEDFTGLWQFVIQAFASILPERYMTVNGEQDLGTVGMRKAKLSYKPVGFVKKYRAVKSREK